MGTLQAGGSHTTHRVSHLDVTPALIPTMRSWSAGLSARGLPAFASRPTLSPPPGPTQPCQTQEASIPIRANTLAREAFIPDKATSKVFNTLAREFSTRAWTGNSTLITRCLEEGELGRGWRHDCQPTAAGGRQM